MAELLRRLGEQLGLFDEARSAAPDSPSPRGHRLLLGAEFVPYQLTRAKRRSIGFVVGPDGLKVRAPRWVSQADIDKVLQARADWIRRQLRAQQERTRQQESLRVQWGEGASLPYLGAPLQVRRGAATQWQAAEGEQPARLALRLPPEAAEAQWRDATQAWLQQQARMLFTDRLAHFAQLLGVPCPKLRLSSAKGRWGSASSSGVVSLNWRLMHFSPQLIDYVVAHEVAHLREMNHGPRFWQVVGELFPGYEGARAALKDAALPQL
jgi:predicted metal-dependent hydrolase